MSFMAKEKLSLDKRKEKINSIKAKKQQKKEDKIPAQIKSAIETDNIDELKKTTEKAIKEFSAPNSGMSAFLFACHKSEIKTIDYIFLQMIPYFENYEDKEEGEDDHCDFFLQSFFSAEEREYNAATILLTRFKSEEGFEFFKKINEKLGFFDFKTEKRELIKNIALPYGTTFEGYFVDSIVERKPRSFPGEREKQLLKQFSTILFFSMKAYLTKEKISVNGLVEIQAMHIYTKTKNYLFISANKSYITKEFSQVFPDEEKLRNILETYQKPRGGKHIKQKLKRYADNFEVGILGENELYSSEDENENDEDISRFKKIKQLIKNSSVKHVMLKYTDSKESRKKPLKNTDEIKNIFKKESAIIFLDTSMCKNNYVDRHVEEFLVDVADIAKECIGNDAHICIGGKKRPCTTCFGRMENFNKTSNDVKIKFGQFPGLIWMQALDTQDKGSAEESLKTLAIKSQHATKNSFDMIKTDYDSSTEDEDQIYSRFDF
jgi:hypothetical protein